MIGGDTISNGPIAWMARRPVVANLLMFIIIFAGLFAFFQTKKEVFPEFSDDTIQIEVPYFSASPTEVEKSIILPVENAISEVDGVAEVLATASEGLAKFSLKLYNGENVSTVSKLVQNSIDRIENLPTDAEKPIVQENLHKANVLTIILYGDVTTDVLKYYSDKIYDILARNNNLGPIKIEGLAKKAIYVEASQINMQKYKLTLPEIAKKIDEYSLNNSAGIVTTDSGELFLRMNERRELVDDFSSLPIISSSKGEAVTLGQIANLYEGFVENDNATSFSGKNAVAINVYRVGLQSPTAISNTIAKELLNIRKILPQKLQLTVLDDRSKVFAQRASLLQRNGILGLFLVLVLLGFFLNIRFAFWVGLGIPIAFSGAFFMFPIADISINLVTMFAFIMCLGIVVDDAIIVGENIFSYRAKGYAPLSAAIIGAKEVSTPIIFSVLTNIVAFLPLFFVPGVMGKIFIYIPAVVVMVFLLSLFESLFILPAHLACSGDSFRAHSFLFKLEQQQQKLNKSCISCIQRQYDFLLKKAIRYRYIYVATAFSALIICFGMLASGRMGLEMFPDIESDIASANITLPQGIVSDNVIAVEKSLLLAAKEALVNTAATDFSLGIYSSIIDNKIAAKIYLTDAEKRRVSTRDIVSAWQRNFANTSGIESAIFSVNNRGPGRGADLTIELSHKNNEVLKLAATWLAEQLSSYNILSSIDDGVARGKKQWNFILTDTAVALGLTTQQIAAQVRAAFHGVEARTNYRAREEVLVIVRLPISERDSEYDINNFIIKTSSGHEVLLRDVVDIEKDISYSSIYRKDSVRFLSVTANAFPKSQLVTIEDDLENKIFKKMQQIFPGISYSYGGKQTDIATSIQSLFRGLFAALVVMYSLLVILLNSFTMPLIILFVIPFSLIGVLLGHLFLGYSLSVLSLFGIVALTGVVINDGVVLVKFIQDNLANNISFAESIISASYRRLLPVMLTSFTTFVGLMPMLLEKSMQAKFLIPMAVSLAFGVLAAMFVTLVIIPCICFILEDYKIFLGRV